MANVLHFMEKHCAELARRLTVKNSRPLVETPCYKPQSMQFTVDTDLAIAGIVIGLIAVVVAVPPLLQMICGLRVWNLKLKNLQAPTANSF
jgi:hypothetical protein